MTANFIKGLAQRGHQETQGGQGITGGNNQTWHKANNAQLVMKTYRINGLRLMGRVTAAVTG